MSYKTILAILACPADVEPVVRAAATLPGGGDIHLLGCHGEPSQFVIMSAPIDVPDVATLTTLYEEADRRMEAIGKAFEEVCRREGVSCEWRPVRTPGGGVSASSLRTARIADLCIVRQPDRTRNDAPENDFEALLFEGGSPVLVLGPDGRFAEAVRRVLVAWDGSREAARAIRDALPFLKQAESVEVLIVDPDRQTNIDPATAGTQIAANLARHGIFVAVQTAASGGRSTAETIETQVRAANADLLVMGGYTHLRLREWLFGGVTRAFMERVPVATLISR